MQQGKGVIDGLIDGRVEEEIFVGSLIDMRGKVMGFNGGFE